MDRTDPEERLGQIPTLWTLVQRAHGSVAPTTADAQEQLISRYGGAIRRYLLGAVRDPDKADELFQEFALRFVHGDLKGATPERGRFRDYVKGVLGHLIADHHNRERRAPAVLSGPLTEPPDYSTPELELDRAFTENWRDELLARAWTALASLEQRSGQPFYTVLRLRADHPDVRSPELAVKVSEHLGKTMTAEGVRQTLHRSREKFAELLLDDVQQSIGTDSSTALEEELTDLGLLTYCRPAVARRSEGISPSQKQT
jgi:RNA polymerase sigma-70 factor (ECF subfamily)